MGIDIDKMQVYLQQRKELRKEAVMARLDGRCGV